MLCPLRQLATTAFAASGWLLRVASGHLSATPISKRLLHTHAARGRHYLSEHGKSRPRYQLPQGPVFHISALCESFGFRGPLRVLLAPPGMRLCSREASLSG